MSLEYEMTHLFTKAGSSHFIPCVCDGEYKGSYKDDPKRESYCISDPPNL